MGASACSIEEMIISSVKWLSTHSTQQAFTVL